MIKGILFDLDGTLLDRDKSLVAFLESQYNRIQAFHVVERQTFIQRFIQLDQKGYVWKDKVYQKLIDELKIDLTWEELLEDYVESFQNHCTGFAGLIELLEFLKSQNLKTGIISNGFGRFQMNNIKGLQIDHYFDEILISENEGLRKPDIEIFKRALSRLGLESQETMFVGDHPVNDVEASINAGMIGVWKEDNHFERPSGDYILINNLMEIKDIIVRSTM
ncbi:HAD family hydrolase [Cohnella terricola]|uniref:HAD family hydrolase n=1 Tax=Cohnella terricola TaxID=1289167 RepID=A0A559J8R7_9BACL|nr:HAD family hydrolase [Cohnella terricola]TVX96290.1 HAD family hydrolase [Cohnella terricola]